MVYFGWIPKEGPSMNKRYMALAAAVAAVLTTLNFWPASKLATKGPDAVHASVQAWQLDEAQRCYEKVRWTEDLTLALELQERSGRPLLLFYSEGPLGRG